MTHKDNWIQAISPEDNKLWMMDRGADGAEQGKVRSYALDKIEETQLQITKILLEHAKNYDKSVKIRTSLEHLKNAALGLCGKPSFDAPIMSKEETKFQRVISIIEHLIANDDFWKGDKFKEAVDTMEISTDDMLDIRRVILEFAEKENLNIGGSDENPENEQFAEWITSLKEVVHVHDMTPERWEEFHKRGKEIDKKRARAQKNALDVIERDTGNSESE